MVFPGLAKGGSVAGSKAQRRLARRQRRYPPRYPRIDGMDRVQWLYRMLEPGLPPPLQAFVARGNVAIGEIGKNTPDVWVRPVATDEFVVELTSGMMDFQYAVGFTLAGLHKPIASKGAAPRTVEEVIGELESTLRQWGRYMRWFSLWPRPRMKWSATAVAKSTRDWIGKLVTVGDASLLAHELAHVAIDTGLVKPLSSNDEVEADRFGLRFMISALEAFWDRRFLYAAPIIPIQIFAAMERLGVEFSEHYPPQPQRIQLLREQIRERCPSTPYYYEVSTVLVAWQDMLDDLVNRIAPNKPLALPDAERVLIRLLAELEEVGKRTVSMATYIEDIEHIAGAYPHTTIQEATRGLIANYAVPSYGVHLLDLPLRIAMAAKLAELVRGLPSNLRPLFP